MQTSTIKFSQIEDRIDAEYYKPEYLKIYNNLEKRKGVVLLEDVAKEVVSGSYIDTYFPKRTLYLRVNNLKEDGFDLSDVKYVDIQYSKVPQKIRVHTNDLVLGRTGTVGTTLIVPNELDGAVMSQHITKIVPSEKINRFYLMIYLNSRHGRLQAEKTALGSMQKELTLDATKNIKVFIPPQSLQQKIEKIVKEAQEKRKLADEKYDEAEEILNKELGLGNLDLSTQKTFEAKFSEAEDRFDPEYYQPVYKNVYKFLKQKSKPLTEVCKIVRTKISPQNTPEKLFNYIEIGGIDNSTGEIAEILNLRGWQVPSGVKYVVRNNDVLLSAVRTYLKGIALVSNNYEGGIATTGFHVLREPIIKPETLFLFLRSRLGLIQFEKFFLGSTYPVIKGFDLKNILVPILSQSLQQKISSLIQESFKLRREAKELIDRAKKEVEEMVIGK